MLKSISRWSHLDLCFTQLFWNRGFNRSMSVWWFTIAFWKHVRVTVDSQNWWKSIQQSHRYFISPILLPSQNLAPTLPTVHLNHWWFGLRFKCYIRMFRAISLLLHKLRISWSDAALHLARILSYWDIGSITESIPDIIPAVENVHPIIKWMKWVNPSSYLYLVAKHAAEFIEVIFCIE